MSFDVLLSGICRHNRTTTAMNLIRFYYKGLKVYISINICEEWVKPPDLIPLYLCSSGKVVLPVCVLLHLGLLQDKEAL